MGPEDELAEFIRQFIPSVWALEVLLLLRREPRAWSEADLVTELRASHTVVRNALRALVGGELALQSEPHRWRFSPASPALDRLVEALQAAYRERPVAVINIISMPSALQSLADAFKFKGDGK